jgi:hypothetical protein
MFFKSTVHVVTQIFNKHFYYVNEILLMDNGYSEIIYFCRSTWDTN